MKYSFLIEKTVIEVSFKKEFLLKLKQFKGKCSFVNCPNCPFEVKFKGGTICIALEKENQQANRERFRLNLSNELLGCSEYKQIDFEV